jgi:threonine 3-dehydrogenase
MLAMLQSGLDVTPVITHRLPMTDFEAGFGALNAGRACKVVLDINA